MHLQIQSPKIYPGKFQNFPLGSGIYFLNSRKKVARFFPKVGSGIVAKVAG